MSGVVLGTNTITIDGSILETGRYKTYEPTSSPSVNITTIDSVYKYMNFPYTSGTNNTAYTITFNENTQCDILIVGGGGAGAGGQGGGGGAGGLVYLQNQLFTGTYNISVGKGGIGAPVATADGFNSIFGIYTAIGGGGGGHYKDGDTSKRAGRTGGSGGGGGNIWTSPQVGDPAGGTTNQPLYNDENGNRQGWGFDGGDGFRTHGGIKIPTGGGGGSGQIGQASPDINTAGNGGNGKQINITGTYKYYAGGGGGGVTQDNGTAGGLGGLGGGGHGGSLNTNVPLSSIVLNGSPNAFPHTGSGGGGKRSGGTPGGNGGSGIVIIRYKYTSDVIQWTYSSSNPNVYHLGNVGIGTTNPTSALQVLGSVQINGDINATTLTANTKNFKIEHPLNLNKWLYHGCVEAPRFDNIYRGKKLVINGTCEVNIDEECNTTGGLTKGTFVSLNTNCQVYLENKQTYDSVYGKITDGILIINCENIKEEIEIDWLVIGERKDNTVITNELTNYNGSLICEHDKDQ